MIPLLLAISAIYLPITLVATLSTRFGQSTQAGANLLRKYACNMLAGAAACAVIAVSVAGAWLAARSWQERVVTTAIEDSLALEWVTVDTGDEPLAASILENGLPIASWAETYSTAPDAWKDATLVRVADDPATRTTGSPSIGLDYYRIVVDASCGAGDVTVAMKYTGVSQTYDHEYIRAFTVPTVRESPSFLLVPVYYNRTAAWTRFDGLGVPSDQRDCLVEVQRARDVQALRLPMVSVVLAPGWRERPLYERLMSVPLGPVEGTYVDPFVPASSDRSGWKDGQDRPLAHVAPRLDAWTAFDGVSVSPVGDTFVVVGNEQPSGYQLVSPVIDVARRRHIAVQIAGTVTSGEMCFGVLDGAQQRWLLAPSDARSGFVVPTRTFEQIRMVFSNCGHPPGEFVVRSITYEALPQ